MKEHKTSLTSGHDARWNAAATIAWTAFIILIWQGLVAVWTLERTRAAGIVITDPSDLFSNAAIAADLMIGVIVGGLLSVLMVVGVIRLKKGSVLGAYLPIRTVSILTFLKWLGLALVVSVVVGAVFQALGFEESKDTYVLLNSDLRSSALMYIAVILAAPISEELLFRGFVISGLERLRLPDPTSIAVAVSSFLWALLHLQYHAHEMFQLFLLGIVLGFARIQTKSLTVPIAIHAINNLLALLLVDLNIGA